MTSSIGVGSDDACRKINVHQSIKDFVHHNQAAVMTTHFMHQLSFGHPEPYQEKQVDDYLAVGPALQILQLNVEGLSTAKTKLECGLTILR